MLNAPLLTDRDIGGIAELSRPQKRFLVRYSETWDMCEAAAESDYSLRTHYEALTENEKYKELWDFIQQAISDVIEQEAIRRGVDGVVKDVWFKGEVAGQERVYSDQLLNTVLRARRPEYAAGAKKGNGETANEEDSRIVLVLPDNRREQMTLDDLKDSSLTSEAKREIENVPLKEPEE